MNLLCMAVAASYLVQIAFETYWHNACGHLAIDYCAFWSAGRLANTNGYAAIYNLDLLRKVESSTLPDTLSSTGFPVSPVAYLPVFILPFQLLSFLAPAPGFWIWALLNLGVLMFYLRFLIGKTSDRPLPPRLLLLTLLGLPVYWNLFNGQVNVWLVICVGEYMRANLSGRFFRAGLWLGGLLIKPQALVLIILFLLWQRAARSIAGLAASAAAILGASWLMIGTSGFASLLGLWLGFAGGLPTNDVGIMMNWRMLGTIFGALTAPGPGWAVIGIGSLITLWAAFYLWRSRIDFQSANFVIALTGLLAATGLIAWHSHVHMAMILIPPLLLLSTQDVLDRRLLDYWTAVPAALYFLAFIGAAAMQARVLPPTASLVLDFLRGAGEFGMNVLLLAWAVRKSASSARAKS